MTSVISALDCQLETNTGRQTELSYIIKKNPDEIKILAPCLVMIGLPCSSVAHSLCKKRKKRKKKKATVAPAQWPLTSHTILLLLWDQSATTRPDCPWKKTKNRRHLTNNLSNCSGVAVLRPAEWIWSHIDTHILCRASTAFFFPSQIFFPRHCSRVVAFWSSRFWPGVMMMLIITLCGVTTLNGARSGHRLPPLLSYFFGVFKAICYWDSTTAAQ